MWNSFFKCSKNTDFSYAVFNSMEAIDSNDWNSIHTEKNIYLSHDYLHAFEKGMQNEIGFKYLIFRNKENEIVAISSFQIVSFKPVELLQDKIPCSIADKIKAYFLEEKKLNLLICGNLFACGENGYAHSDQITTSAFLEILSEAISNLYKEDATTKISFALFKEFWPKSIDQTNILTNFHFKEIHIDVNMVLPIHSEWTGFKDYLDSMNTKYRTRAKNVLKKSKNLEKIDFTTADIEKNLSKIQKMYTDVLSNADYNLGVLDVKTFVHLKEKLQDNFNFTAYFLEGNFIGFSTAFLFDGIVDANFIGIDYSYNKEYKLYQRMLYDYVHLSIDNNANELRLGRTAETIKSVLGAKPIPMKLYTRHRNSISTSMLSPLLSSISPNEYEIRKPFKN